MMAAIVLKWMPLVDMVKISYKYKFQLYSSQAAKIYNFQNTFVINKIQSTFCKTKIFKILLTLV